MIVIDSSAIVSIAFGEPAAERLLARLAADPDRVMSAASYVETATVLAGRRTKNPGQAIADLNGYLTEATIMLAPVDAEQARIAANARIRFGRGMGHGGALNFGDTFSYALAIVRNAPLLFVGNDFRATDVAAAL